MTEHDSAYDVAAPAWDAGPGRLYRATASALLDAPTVRLAGARVLDVGAGTGIAGMEALRRGAAQVVATDRAAEMLRLNQADRDVLVADACALPFPDASFDVVVAAFLVNHLDDPGAALREFRRVAPAVLTSTFDASWEHPAKTVVDEVMIAAGFEPPSWYAEIKTSNEQVSDPHELARLARGAGYRRVEVTKVDVPTPISGPEAMVEWRWGMAHLAPFVTALDDAARADLRHRAEQAARTLPPVVVPMLALSAW